MRTLSELQRAYDARSDDEPDEPIDRFLASMKREREAVSCADAWCRRIQEQEDTIARMRQSLKVIEAMADGLIALKAEPCLDDLQEILDEAKKGLGEAT